ncbi:hypothetical protein EVAR_17227_1 [Eumeta japonica]|uniref:Uncharacterized protein n=1 Tax=Eumeta variegata TaxID=151549 RepID=A0A4C1U8W1_EUMVA|nr:hypothetical protein EVAR_17227_1 [Eumeta japonica]
MMQIFADGDFDTDIAYDIVTGDESWIYCYDLETKRQFSPWVLLFEELSKSKTKMKTVTSFFGVTDYYATVASEDKKQSPQTMAALGVGDVGDRRRPCA